MLLEESNLQSLSDYKSVGVAADLEEDREQK